MKREQFSEDGLKRTTWWFLNRDANVFVAKVFVETKPSKRHRKWVTMSIWDNWRDGPIPALPPQDVIDSVLDEVRASVKYVEPKTTREW